MDPMDEVGERYFGQGQDNGPVRLCCNQRHWGPVCPDGKVMCQLCFDRFEIKDLSRNAMGDIENTCKACVALEREQLNGQ